jgi:hypothetical protein
MKLVLVAMVSAALVSAAVAQQGVPLTDWRASLENDLSKLSMPRDAHAQIFNILQAYERQAQIEKMKQAPPVEPPK